MPETLNSVDLDATAGELVQALAARRLSAAELTDAAITRIEARDAAINAVVVRDFDRAREAATAADAALARGERAPLLGLPITVKEAHDVAGLPTTWGFDAARDHVATEDSVAVARLKAAGAIILGKTNVPVALSDWQSVNPIYGRTRNPWNLDRSPGGSSGGSAAALAAGMVPLELGSDIGGSIRIPSALCGVFGHKPSWELIPQRGHRPPGAAGPGPVLNVVGPMARSVADLTLALDVLAGPDIDAAQGYRLALPPPRGQAAGEFRVLVVDQVLDAPVDGEIAAALHAVADRLEAMGARVSRDAGRLPDQAAQREVYMGLLSTVMSRGAPGAVGMSAHDWLQLRDRQWAIRREWGALFDEVDIVLAPALGVAAFPHDDDPDGAGRRLQINGQPAPYFGQLVWPALASLPHLPSTVAPVGRTREGLPIGLQAIGPYLGDRTALAFAALLEREFGGFQAPPPLS